jgi:DNA-directed RNA polymerase specialized sigma24 family protein
MISSGEHREGVGRARARLDSRTLTQLQPAIEAELRAILARGDGGLLPSPFNLDVLEDALARVVARPDSPDERRRYLLFVAPVARRLMLAHAASTRRAESRLDAGQIDRWLARLESFDPLSALMIDLRYFAGLSLRRTATVAGVSAPTVIRDMRFAKAWLAAYLGEPLRPRRSETE